MADNWWVVSSTETASVHYIVWELADGRNILLEDCKGANDQLPDLVESKRDLLTDSLSFDFTDLFSDDSGIKKVSDSWCGVARKSLLSSHLLQNEKFLLDDRDAERLADDYWFLFCFVYGDLGRYLSREVILSVEVIKATQGGETTPVVERGITASWRGNVSICGLNTSVLRTEALSLGFERSCEGTAGQSGDGEQSECDLGEHGCQIWRMSVDS